MREPQARTNLVEFLHKLPHREPKTPGNYDSDTYLYGLIILGCVAAGIGILIMILYAVSRCCCRRRCAKRLDTVSRDRLLWRLGFGLLVAGILAVLVGVLCQCINQIFAARLYAIDATPARRAPDSLIDCTQALAGVNARHHVRRFNSRVEDLEDVVELAQDDVDKGYTALGIIGDATNQIECVDDVQEELLTLVAQITEVLDEIAKEVDDIMYPVNKARRKIHMINHNFIRWIPVFFVACLGLFMFCAAFGIGASCAESSSRSVTWSGRCALCMGNYWASWIALPVAAIVIGAALAFSVVPVWKSTSASGAAVLARSSGEESASPRHRAGVASMAWRTMR